MIEKTSLLNFYEDGSDLEAIELCEPDPEVYSYKPSDLEHFDKVFHKDSFPTYHQMYDNFLHWIWNEYNNDPNKFDSDEYHEKILNKVFAFINARVYGILNPIDNHDQIIQFLRREFSEYDITKMIREKYQKMYDRETEFTKDDAIIWYEIEDQYIFNGYKPKPLIIPCLVDGTDNYLGLDKYFGIFNPHIFYKLIFQYTIDYYNHLYAGKFRGAFLEVQDDDYIVGKVIQDPDLIQEPKELIDDIFMDDTNLIQIKDLDLSIGDVKWLLVSSQNGQFHDMEMNPYTYAMIARSKDGIFISGQRGVDIFRNIAPERYHTNNIILEKHWLNTLVSRAKDVESLLAEQWRDILQCNCVLFYKGDDRNMNIHARITHVSKYEEKLSKIGVHVKKDEYDIFMFDITGIEILLKLWEIFNHTLDFWVSYVIEGDLYWSLISNIFEHDSQYYIDNPHIQYVTSDNNPIEPGKEIVSIVPRDGMMWVLDGQEFHFIPAPINGFFEMKAYLG